MNKLLLIAMLSSTTFIMSCSPANKKSSLPQPQTANTLNNTHNTADVTPLSITAEIKQIEEKDIQVRRMRWQLEKDISALTRQIKGAPANAEELKKQLSLKTHENDLLKKERISSGKRLGELQAKLESLEK